ncbi:DUF805 domain-containing protein [Lactiplantibacillus daowaiensis]|uniref:DUF805 domain-containing protein n=1 Tax=Lactiplantibacillus daowaiensis TaxID=2559918 RepID=A0ABW1S1W4_9LACO|nr:DUF805 domain-containing protein [Lactiplantibacillus daowaiensis]
MNFCPKCGTAVSQEVRFCPKCGFDLSGTSTANSTSTVTPEAVSAQPTPMRTATSTNDQAQWQATTATATAETDYQSNFGFMGATKELFNHYVTFSGRMSRANFWWAYLGYLVLYLIAMTLYYSFGDTFSSLLLIAIVLIYTCPLLSAASRRLHDTNRSFGYYWVLLIPIVGAIWLIVLLCKAGDEQANRFG